MFFNKEFSIKICINIKDGVGWQENQPPAIISTLTEAVTMGGREGTRLGAI